MNALRRFIVVLLILPLFFSTALSALSLDSCIQAAERNYPLTKQLDIIRENLSLNLENLSRNLWPQLQINGQYTYQSAVTGLPIQIPNIHIPTINKNQYKVYADINQVIYDGGVNNSGKSIAQASSSMEEEKLKTDLYKIKEKVSQLYFGVLLNNEKMAQLMISKKDIEVSIEKVHAAVSGGVSLPSSEESLRAEYLKLEQKIIETEHDKSALLRILSLLMGQEISQSAKFEIPMFVVNETVNRPELKLMDKQLAVYHAQNNLLKAKNMPKVNLFLQTGYGRPALNMLNNEAQGYYIGGLRFSIPISGLYTYKNESNLLEAYKKSVELQRSTFMLNTSVSMAQEDEEMKKFQELLSKDDELIKLRISIREVALKQLENGVITASDYLREMDAEENARLGKSLHQLQLLMHQYNKQLITGN